VKGKEKKKKKKKEKRAPANKLFKERKKINFNARHRPPRATSRIKKRKGGRKGNNLKRKSRGKGVHSDDLPDGEKRKERGGKKGRKGRGSLVSWRNEKKRGGRDVPPQNPRKIRTSKKRK